VQRERLLRAIHRLAVILFWPAIALVAWGELSKNQDATALEGLFWDKSLHFRAYFGLSGMICLALKEPRRVLVAAITLILFAGALEILQGYTGRDPDMYDELANTLGVISGSAIGYLIIGLLTPKRLAVHKPN
jgi:VanZ family protein